MEESLRSAICGAIRTNLSPRHVPAHVLQVQDIPYTLTGKRIKNVVKSVVCGEVPNMGSAIANPESLKDFDQFLDLPVAGRPTAKLYYM